jgi:hypothetical protein
LTAYGPGKFLAAPAVGATWGRKPLDDRLTDRFDGSRAGHWVLVHDSSKIREIMR